MGTYEQSMDDLPFPENSYENFDDREEVIERFRTSIENAESELSLSISALLLPEIAPEIRDALSRGVVVLLLVGDSRDGSGPPERASELGTVVRYWDIVGNLLTKCIADYKHGIVANQPAIDPDADGGRAFGFADEFLGYQFFSALLSTDWSNGQQVHVTDPRPLPAEYDNYFRAIIDASQYLNEGRKLHLEADVVRNEDMAETTIDGQLVNVRQNIVYPATNTFPTENNFYVRTDRGRESLGGPGASVEDYRFNRIRLYELDE